MSGVRSFTRYFLIPAIFALPGTTQATIDLGPGITKLIQPTPIVDAALQRQVRLDIGYSSGSRVGVAGSSFLAELAGAAPDINGMAKPDELNLVRAVSNAVNTHPSVRQTIDFLSQSGDFIDVAKAGYYPQVRGGVSTEHNSRDLDRYDARTLHRWTVSASQMLYDFGEVASAVSGAEAERAAARARVLLSIDQVSRETSYAFIELQRYQALQTIAEAQVAGVSAIADLAHERRVKGASTLSDELQAQSREEAARATLLDMKAQADQWRHSIRYLTGLSNIEGLSADLPPTFQQSCQGDVPQWGILPEVLVAEAERAVALADLEHASAQSLPTLTLEGSVSRALNATPRTGSKNDASAMLNFSMPFYQGGSMQAQKRAASHALNAADAAGNHARLTASQSLVEARSREQGYRQRIDLLEQRIDSIHLTRDLYREQYLQLGTRSLLDLLNAEQEYHQASFEKTNNEHDMRRMQIDCLYNSGRLREVLDLNDTAVAGVEIMP